MAVIVEKYCNKFPEILRTRLNENNDNFKFSDKVYDNYNEIPIFRAIAKKHSETLKEEDFDSNIEDYKKNNYENYIRFYNYIGYYGCSFFKELRNLKNMFISPGFRKKFSKESFIKGKLIKDLGLYEEGENNHINWFLFEGVKIILVKEFIIEDW